MVLKAGSAVRERGMVGRLLSMQGSGEEPYDLTQPKPSFFPCLREVQMEATRQVRISRSLERRVPNSSIERDHA